MNTKKSSHWARNKIHYKNIAIYTFLTLKWFLISGLVSCFIVGGVVFGYVTAVVKDEPVRDVDYMMTQMQEDAKTGFVYFNDETVLGQLRTDEDRRMISYNEIPPMVEAAVLSVEDDDFYSHPGINFKSIMRVVMERVRNEAVQTGGSTITQQVARRVFLTLDKDVSRKFKEIFLALRIERVMGKQEILTAYLNKIPYGNGSSGYNLYGIKAAAKGIFNIDDLNQLNIAQSAYLAGLPQLPSRYSAYKSDGSRDEEGLKSAITRQQLVLKRMHEEGHITEAEYKTALAFDITASLAASKEKAYTTYPYLMIDAERKAAEILMLMDHPELSDKKGTDSYREAMKEAQLKLQRGGYSVHTTIDKTLYDEMQLIAQNPENFSPDDEVKGVEQVGAMMINHKTGAILGMIEGRDFKIEQMNHATQAYRQPGSTMKVLAAYLPALEAGIIQPGSVIDDVPIVLPDWQRKFHIPANWNNRYHGLMTARYALNRSYNIPAVRLFVEDVGIEKAWEFVRSLGITSIGPEDDHSSTGVIGGLYQGTTVEEMTNAFGAIANNGVFNDAYMIEKILDSNGKLIYEHPKTPERVFSEETAFLMTDMMRTVISDPVSTAADLRSMFKHYSEIPVVGKTGSTQGDGDAWFIGYSPDITVGVWIGYEQQIHSLVTTAAKNRAKSIWAKVMDMAAEKKPELMPTTEFAKPENVVRSSISAIARMLPKTGGNVSSDYFNKAYLSNNPTEEMLQVRYITYNGINYVAHPETPDDMVEVKEMIQRKESIASIIDRVEKALAQMPSKYRKPIEYYIPVDADMDAPSETDPRTDDGEIPNAPGEITVTRNGNMDRISFEPSSSGDVVGYRLYGASTPLEYERLGGRVVLAGSEPIFIDVPANYGMFGYYVTAVDVAGKESPPSKSANAGGIDAVDPNNPSGTDDPDGSDGSEEPDEDGSDESPAPPTAPTNVKIKMDGTTAEITWKTNNKRERITQYNVYFNTKETGEYQQVGSTNGAGKLQLTNPVPGYFRITAINALGESSPSAAAQLKE